jgi:glycosyltransferase involved in cell wall biosynthesis
MAEPVATRTSAEPTPTSRASHGAEHRESAARAGGSGEMTTPRTLRVLALLPYPLDQAPSQRYRLEQWVPGLRALGIECDLVPFVDRDVFRRLARPGRPSAKVVDLLRAVTSRWRLLRRATDYDLVVVHREAMLFGPALLERVVAWRRPMVLDFDDAIWLSNHNPVNPFAKWLKFPGKSRVIARQASAVVAGNEYLAEWARRYNPATYVIPTTIDTDGMYSAKKEHRTASKPVVGWTGTASTLRYLEHIRPVLEELARRRRYRLVVISEGAAPSWNGVEVELHQWSSAREVEDLLELDVGLMPQPDEEWARGKCGCKALQYMALGIPPVASRNGALPEIIENGRTGFLASTPAEWLTSLERLIDDVALRASLGDQARFTVRERYSANSHVPRIAEILRSVA